MSCPDIQNNACELAALLQGRSPDTNWLSKLFVTMTRGHMSSVNNYGDLAKVLDGLVWTGAKSRLQIEPHSPAGASITGAHIPGVFVNVGKFNYTNEVIGDIEGTDEANSISVLTTRANSALQLVCLHEHAAASANMANTLLVFFQACKPLFTTLGIFSFSPDTMAGPDPAKVGDMTYHQTMVLFRFQFHQRVTISLGGHTLRDIVFDLQNSSDDDRDV